MAGGDPRPQFRQPGICRRRQGNDLLHFLPDTNESLPSTLLERAELEKLLAASIERIPEIEQTVLSLYYHEELTLREIAQVVNLHESRISQLKSQAIMRLRSQLAEQWPATRGMVERMKPATTEPDGRTGPPACSTNGLRDWPRSWRPWPTRSPRFAGRPAARRPPSRNSCGGSSPSRPLRALWSGSPHPMTPGSMPAH